MRQQRKSVRFAVRLPVTYRVLEQTRQAMTQDLGPGGLSLEGGDPLLAGTSIQGELQLPNRERPVSFTAKVIACERVESANRLGRAHSFQARVTFVQLDPDEAEAIGYFIASVLNPQR